MDRRTLIGEILVDGGWITVQQLRVALAWQRRWGGRLGRALVGLGYIDEPALVGMLGRQLGVAVVDLEGYTIPPGVLRLVPEKVMRERRVVPVALRPEGRREALLVATADPLDMEALDDVAFASGKTVRPVLATEWDIDRALSRHLARRFQRGLGGLPGAAETEAADASGSRRA
ncbi:MAG TPA: hypothetical protein VMT17_13405 [Anaeromyxobacteraceae bacterium]|nr:hypothetical protein [Anaeromyxobacteraceae bacterium]